MHEIIALLQFLGSHRRPFFAFCLFDTFLPPSFCQGLHQERLQSFMFGGSASDSNPAGDSFLQHRVLEEELDLQLSLLNANDSLRNSLFPPEQDMTMTAITTTSDDCEPQQQQYSMGAKLIRDQMSLEAMGLCLAILTLWFVPQLLSE